MVTIKDIHEIHRKFQEKADALWDAFKAGAMTHAEYRAKLDPLEAQLNHDLDAAWREKRKG